MRRDTMPLVFTLGALRWVECRCRAAHGTRDGGCFARHAGATAKAPFKKPQSVWPAQFSDSQLRTLRRRVKAWRSDKARELLLFGTRRRRLITDQNHSDGTGASNANNNDN